VPSDEAQIARARRHVDGVQVTLRQGTRQQATEGMIVTGDDGQGADGEMRGSLPERKRLSSRQGVSMSVRQTYQAQWHRSESDAGAMDSEEQQLSIGAKQKHTNPGAA